MKKFLALTLSICIVSILSQINAQSIDRKTWKAYLGSPINDTVSLHLNSDSSFMTNSSGQIVIRVSCTITGDILTIVNKEADEHGCPDQKGTYTINLKDNGFKLSVVNDSCEGRAQALAGVMWTEAAKNERPGSTASKN